MISNFVKSIGDGLTNLIKSFIWSENDTGLSLLGIILIVFCGISLSLGVCLKTFKFLGGRIKEDVAENVSIQKEKTEFIEIVKEHKHIENEYYCVYCGSVTSSNKCNCRNCGSDEFIRK